MDKIHQDPCAVCIGFFLLSIPKIAGVLKLNHQCVFVCDCVCGLGVSNGVATWKTLSGSQDFIDMDR